MDLVDPSWQTPLSFVNDSGTSPNIAATGVQTPNQASTSDSTANTTAAATETAEVPEGTKVVQAAPARNAAATSTATAADTSPLPAHTGAKTESTQMQATAETAASHQEGERKFGSLTNPKSRAQRRQRASVATCRRGILRQFPQAGRERSSDNEADRGTWRRRRDPNPNCGGSSAAEPTNPPRGNQKQHGELPVGRFTATWERGENGWRQ